MTTTPSYRPSRLGFGEYEPTDGASSRASSRMMFLRAVQRHVPAVLTTLAGEPFHAYRAGKPRLTQRALLAWSRRWHLEAGWCLERGKDTLRMWASQPPDSASLNEWAYEITTSFLPANADARRFTFTHPGWEPSSDFTTRTEAERGMRRDFEAHLCSYLDDMEALARATGMRRTPEKRTLEHFDWLARYQVEGLSYAKLADEVCRSRQTVMDGVKAAAECIGLPLRGPGKAGRPTKAAD